MKKYSWEFFEDVFNIDSEDERSSLGRNYEEVKAVLEVTLNYPRNKRYMAMDDTMRKKLYETWFSQIVEYYRVKYNYVTSVKYRFEPSNVGIHLHGYIVLNMTGLRFNAYGLVEETFRKALEGIPPGKNAVNTWAKSIVSDNFPRIICPAVCIDFCYENALAGWENYIEKFSHK